MALVVALVDEEEVEVEEAEIEEIFLMAMEVEVLTDGTMVPKVEEVMVMAPLVTIMVPHLEAEAMVLLEEEALMITTIKVEEVLLVVGVVSIHMVVGESSIEEDGGEVITLEGEGSTDVEDFNMIWVIIWYFD